MNGILDNVSPRVLGQRLQAARKSRRLTQEQVAQELSVSRTTIVAIEKGERQVRPLELAQMAKLYNRPAAELLGSVEQDPAFAVQLRSASANLKDADAFSECVEEFERLCGEYLLLEQMRAAPLPRHYPSPFDISGVEPERAAEDVANAERNRLGLGDGPILSLRSLLENDVGLRIFYIDMPSHVAAMCAFTERIGGAIAVNRKHPSERRRLSLAHEYGHFVTRRDQAEVSYEGKYQRVPRDERFANAFSFAFLMPASGLSRRFNDIRRSRSTGVTPADLCRLAHLYYVSVEALTIRLESLDLLRPGTWDRLKDKGFRVREAQELLDLPAQAVSDRTVPNRYLCLAVEAYEEGQISEGRLARLLRVERLDARRLAIAAEPSDHRGGSSADSLLGSGVVS